jgi:hypothetical protein
MILAQHCPDIHFTRTHEVAFCTSSPYIGTVRLSIDWTIEDQQHLLVASLCTGSRAIPLYWRPYNRLSFRDRRSSYERDFASSLIDEVLHPRLEEVRHYRRTRMNYTLDDVLCYSIRCT